MPLNTVAIDLNILDGNNGFRLDGGGPGHQAGYSVSSAGDINGDGFDDVIVGAPGASGLSPGSGCSYVVFGTNLGFSSSINLSTLNGTNGFRIRGIGEADHLGGAASSAGDVNGDGMSDIVVGAFLAGTYDAGASYVIFGRSTGFTANLNLSGLTGNNGFRISGASNYDHSGCSVSTAGDVNGDGFDDIIVGAYGVNVANNYSVGASYVVFGKADGFSNNINLSSLDSSAGFRILGVSAGDKSGDCVSTAGDVNGDGLDDLIIGAVNSSPNGKFLAGTSYVVFGRASGFGNQIELASLNGSNGFKVIGAKAGDESGFSVSTAGDLNGDGYDEIIIGAENAATNGQRDTGAAYVIYGKPSGFASSYNLANMNGTNGFRINGVSSYGDAGRSVSNAGDVNGDGFGDLIVGAIGAENGTGASYVVFGSAEGPAANFDLASINGSNGFKLAGLTQDDRLGESVSSAGDINGDGFDDIVVGARRADPHGIQSGTSFVVFGSRSLDAVNIVGTNLGLTHNGGYGNDTITAFGGNDTIRAWEGDDLVSGGLGDDVVDGGSENDTLYGNAGSDSLVGGFGNDYLNGGDGDDTLEGGEGFDELFGGDGNDTLNGGLGEDVLSGGKGDDVYFTEGDDKIVEKFNSGIDTIYSATSFTLKSNMENLVLFGIDDIFGFGNSLNNSLTGDIHGNVLRGAAGADILIGGKGRDVLVGGSGRDTFQFSLGDSGQSVTTLDRISDYAKGSSAAGDRFDFSANLSVGGDQSAATSNKASINQLTGVATFGLDSGNTMMDALNDIANGFSAAEDSVGEFALFRVSENGPYYIFVSDGVAGVGSQDLLVQFSNISIVQSIEIASGDLFILS